MINGLTGFIGFFPLALLPYCSMVSLVDILIAGEVSGKVTLSPPYYLSLLLTYFNASSTKDIVMVFLSSLSPHMIWTDIP
jgi:hypothetical protein